MATFVSYTSGNGYAVASYRLPKYDDTVMPFGNYTVTAFVEVAQSKSKRLLYLPIQLRPNILLSNTSTFSCSRTTTSFTVTVQCNSFIQQNYYLSWTLTDSNNIPIISGETFAIAYPNFGGNSQAVTLIFQHTPTMARQLCTGTCLTATHEILHKMLSHTAQKTTNT